MSLKEAQMLLVKDCYWGFNSVSLQKKTLEDKEMLLWWGCNCIWFKKLFMQAERIDHVVEGEKIETILLCQ